STTPSCSTSWAWSSQLRDNETCRSGPCPRRCFTETERKASRAGPAPTRAVLVRLIITPYDRTFALPLGLVAAGLRQPGYRHRRHLRARPADHRIHPDRCVCRFTRFRPAASVPARAPALRTGDPRLEGAWCGVAAGQVGGDDRDGGQRPGAAGHHALGRRPSLVDGGPAHPLHGRGRDMVVAAPRAIRLTLPVHAGLAILRP